MVGLVTKKRYINAVHVPCRPPPPDINKFLWMVRIGGSTDTGKHIKEHDYYTPTGEFRVDREGSPVLLNCLMYKMCYYRFGQVYTEASESQKNQTQGSRLLPLRALTAPFFV